MARTWGAMFSCANWRTVARNSCSSSESRVRGEAGWEARTESATKIKLCAERPDCPASLQGQHGPGYGKEPGGRASTAQRVLVADRCAAMDNGELFPFKNS